jgi:hypothetical protein
MMEVGMTLAHRSLSNSRVVVHVALLAVLASGCNKVTSGGTAPTPTQSAIQDVQSDYSVGPERPVVLDTDPGFRGQTIDDAAAPTMTIATLTLRPGRPRGTRQFLARITSDRDYVPLGIYEGRNYVWRNTWDSTAVAAANWVNAITPARRGRPDYRLTRDPRRDRYRPFGARHEPSLWKVTVRSVAFIVCLDDPACPTGHCGHF